MTTKTTRQASTGQGNGPEVPLDVTAQARQLALASSATSMMYRAAEAMQKVQQQWMQRAALRHQQLSERLQEATSAADMLAIQSTMMTTSLQEAGLYWQELATAGLQAHSAMAEMARSLPVQGSVTPPAANPVFQAWQTMFSVPLNGAFNGAATHH